MPASNERITVVVPAFRVEREIARFLEHIPAFVHEVIVVDDASPDRTAEIAEALARRDRRIVVLRHDVNGGVGLAMRTGFAHALAHGATIVAKMDGDGQMSWADLPRLLKPLLDRTADCSKGNRFRDFLALRRMPPIRRFGNMLLSFLSKAATGYWHIFDPTNGFVAMRAQALELISLRHLDARYFFEQSLLAELYLIRAVVVDVDLPARYESETSNLSIRRVAIEFPPKLAYRFVRRIWLTKFLFDFNMGSVYILTALPMTLFALVFGGYHWIKSTRTGIPAPTGTVVLPTLLIILAVQFMLAAIELDIRSVPTRLLTSTPTDAESSRKEEETQRTRTPFEFIS